MIDSFEKMNIECFQEVCEILKDETTTDFEKQVRLLTILTDNTEDDIMNMPLNELGKLTDKIQFIKEYPQRKTPPSSITLNGKKYDIKYDIQNITTSQYIDFQTFIKDYENKMVEMVSIVVIPKGKKYNDGYDIMEVQNDIRKYMDIVTLMSISFFFQVQLQALTKSLTSSLIRQMKKMMKKEKDKVKKIKMGRIIVQMMELQKIPING